MMMDGHDFHIYFRENILPDSKIIKETPERLWEHDYAISLSFLMNTDFF